MSVEWDVFAQALAEELPNLPEGGLVVIAEPGEEKYARYTQFMQREDELWGYVVVNSFLDESARASEEAERIISAAGWRAPEPSAGHDNWWAALPWPATAEQYLHLTQMVVAGLRDGYGIPDPGVFRYKAWNRNTGEDLDFPRLGLPRD
ncbi:MAG: hypothetical protein JWO67_205 [Streptosporangiaceae bacterium]|nr:hypothetical protein [Streptosporangiaceae bacterium]